MSTQRLTATVLMLAALVALQLRAAPALSEESHAPGAAQELTSDQMEADFELMRHALEEAHPGLYR